jgi:L-glutamine---4-(methylsulfanyl)-2-oxobutanoate aminotransferase
MTDDDSYRPRPTRLARLPDQFFKGILAQAAQAAAQPGPEFIDLGRGNPDIAPPPHAIEALRSAAEHTTTPQVHGYPPFGGHPDLKRAIAHRYKVDHGVEIDPDREVAVVPGTKTGIMLASLAAAGDGDAVLLPDPGYPDYLSGAALAGARVIPLRLDPDDDFQPRFDEAENDPATRDIALVVLNYPSNPTGATERPGTFEQAVAFARERGAWVLNDLAYGFLAYDGARARSILEVPDARDVALELWSPSKIYGMAGWRVGLAVGAAPLIARIQTLLDHVTAGVWTGIQSGLTAALTSDQQDVADRLAIYERRRDLMVSALTAAGAPTAPARGSFFLWWKLPPGVTPQKLIEQHRVGVAPGEGFGANGAGWARLSLALPDGTLAEAAARLTAASTA